MTGLRTGWIFVFLALAAPAMAASAPAPAVPAPPVRVVAPAAVTGSLHRVRVCHMRLVRRRDQDRHWHNERVKVCHLEWVRR